MRGIKLSEFGYNCPKPEMRQCEKDNVHKENKKDNVHKKENWFYSKMILFNVEFRYLLVRYMPYFPFILCFLMEGLCN